MIELIERYIETEELFVSGTPSHTRTGFEMIITNPVPLAILPERVHDPFRRPEPRLPAPAIAVPEHR